MKKQLKIILLVLVILLVLLFLADGIYNILTIKPCDPNCLPPPGTIMK